LIEIRPYEETDAAQVGRLIAATYSEFNLGFASPAERELLLGPFRHAWSTEPGHQEAIARAISASMVLVAEEDGEIAGVLRGRRERLQSLFVAGKHQRRGIGRQLVSCFEAECIRQRATAVRVAATLYAVPFYRRMGYKKTTGVRPGWSFEGHGLVYQPMKKELQKVGL